MSWIPSRSKLLTVAFEYSYLSIAGLSPDDDRLQRLIY